MESISKQLPNVNLYNRLSSTEENLQKTQQSAASLSLQQSSDIVLYTQEGDKVTLSSAASFEASYATYSSQALLNGTSSEVNAEAYSSSQSFSFELSIEGDLNEKELKDLTKAFKTIEKITSDFFSGKTDKALERSEKIAKLDSISSFEAILQYSKALSVETQTETRPAPSPTVPAPQPALPVLPTEGADASNPATTSPIPEPIPPQGPNLSPQTEVAAEDAALIPATLNAPAAPVSDTPKSLLRELTNSLRESDVIPQKLGRYLDRFLNRVFSKLSQEKELDDDGRKEVKATQSELVRRLELSFERSETEGVEKESDHEGRSRKTSNEHSNEHDDD